MSISFPTTLDVFTTRATGETFSELHINDIQDAIEALEAKVGVTNSAVATSLEHYVNNFFNASTNTPYLWFYMTTVPTRWTLYSSSSDELLATKSDSGTYSAVGLSKGSWTQPNHTLTTTEMPSHRHYVQGRYLTQSGAGGYVVSGNNVGTPTNITAQNAGSGSAHNHGSTYRPYATVGILGYYSG